MPPFISIGNNYDLTPNIFGSQHDAPRQRARLRARTVTADRAWSSVCEFFASGESYFKIQEFLAKQTEAKALDCPGCVFCGWPLFSSGSGTSATHTGEVPNSPGSLG
jgi:hypothetical protein